MIQKLIAASVPYLPKNLVWQFSKRYIAGENLENAVKISKVLNDKGILVTVDLLGEFISDLDQATENTLHYLRIIDAFQQAKIQSSFSLKPTSFGLLIDKEACYRNIRKIVSKASVHHCFVRIDMENSICTDLEIDLFTRLHQEFPNHVAIVLQAYMRRTLSDLTYLSTLKSSNTPINVRLCKGIYVEAEKIAFKDFDEIRKHFLEDLEYLFSHNMFAAIATHDAYLVSQAFLLIKKYKLAKENYEFQMLYGVTPNLRDEIITAGHPMRVYVPFGKDWFAYCTRRLKENPKIASDIIKALFIRG